MSSLLRARRLPLRLLVVASAALVLLATVLVDVAFSHGSTIDPPSRNYGCWQRDVELERHPAQRGRR